MLLTTSRQKKGCFLMTTAEKVVEAAKRLFAQKGYEGVSVRDVCDAAEVSPNAVHYHFKSKQNLYVSIIEAASGAKLERVERILQGDVKDRSDFRTRLEIFMEETLITFLEDQDTMKICFAEISQLFPHTKDLFRNNMMRSGEILLEFFGRGQSAGFVRDDIDVSIITGLIHDRICNQTLFCKAFEIMYDQSTEDPIYRRYWIQKNIDLILTGIFIHDGETAPS